MMIEINRLYRALAPDIANLLSDDDRDGLTDSGTIECLLADGEQDVRAALYGAGYSSPEQLTDYLQDLAVTLAIERLLERRQEVEPGPWRERADRARIILREIEEGRRAVEGMSRGTRIQSANENQKPVYTKSSLRPY